MDRGQNYKIMPEIIARYATKNFSPEALSREELLPLIEAARWAPSCFNEQEWRYIIGDTKDSHAKLASTLAKGNEWAERAPVLLLVMCTKTFALNDKENEYARFDAGMATAMLQLEAIRRGIASHCMAGFDHEQARSLFGISDHLDIICLIAMGKPMPLDQLSEEQLKMEVPGTRFPLEKFIVE